MHKLDFTNLLDRQISDIENQIRKTEAEISIRKKQMTAEEAEKDFSTDIAFQIDCAVNERIISELEGGLASKKDFLHKLKEKKIYDTAELDQDFFLLEKEKETIIELAKNAISDPHDVLRFNYLLSEFELWYSKTEDPSRKEACVAYFRGIKEMLKEYENNSQLKISK